MSCNMLQVLKAHPWLCAIIAALVAILTKNLVDLYRNIRQARRSGIPYVVLPVYSYNTLFAIFGTRFLLPFLDRLLGGPPLTTTSWRWLVRASWPWRLRHAPFAALGTDTFLAVSPGGMTLYTADADVVDQILGRGGDFPRPTFLYKNVAILGPSVITSKGADWRRHRRRVAPAFGERNNRLVWEETVRQARVLLGAWTIEAEGHAAAPAVVRTVQRQTMRLSLNVIGRAGFGQDMGLPMDTAAAPGAPSYPSLDGRPAGFANSLELVLRNILVIVTMPRWLLKSAPSKALRASYTSLVEVSAYLQELLRAKQAQLLSAGPDTPFPKVASATVDLLDQLIKGQAEGSISTKDHSLSRTITDGLSDSEVLGNAFVFMFAGHETTGGTLNSLITMLALHPDWQLKLQRALDGILISARVTPSTIAQHYSSLLPALLANPYINAFINETFRLQAPIPTIPKWVPPALGPQPLVVNDKDVLVPPGTMIKLCVSCVHRNPRHWPHQPITTSLSSPVGIRQVSSSHWTSWPPSNTHNDLEAFRPERWLQLDAATNTHSLVTPPPGAFLPFSEGPRSCLGKRFAQVEILAVLAVLLPTHSVELATEDEDDTAPPANAMPTLQRAGAGRGGGAWEAAAEKANETWRRGMSMVITLQLRGAHVPVRFVDRGRERYSRG